MITNTVVFFKKAALCISLILAFGSCSGQQSSVPETESVSAAEGETMTEAVTENTVKDPSEMSDEEYKKYFSDSSIISSGNARRLKSAFAKAESGGELTVAYIGGSITEGIKVKPEECWAKLSFDHLTEMFPKAKMNYVNAGMSGTPSSLGIIRAERDVLAPYGDPDIVFIEFAVNDAQDSTSKEAYESLVRRMLGLSPDTAVILLFMRTDSGYSCQKHMSEIGYHYGLPMISVNDALTQEINAGRLLWSDYADDGAHPNVYGNLLVTDMINDLFDSVYSGIVFEGSAEGWDRDITSAADTEPLYGASFENTHMLDRTNLTPVSLGEYSDTKDTIAWFPNGWTRKGGENKGISFDITCKDLFIVYHCNNSEKYGTAYVYSDGEKVSEVKSYAKDGWSNPVPQLVFRSDELKTHRIEIKMKEGSLDTYFGILAFGYTD